MGEYRVLITGSRTWRDKERIRGALDAVLAEVEADGGRLVVVVGDASRGADYYAHGWYVDRSFEIPVRPVKLERHVADWRKHGRQAGYLRNAEMVEADADLAFAYLMPCELARCASRPPHPTHGGDHCATLAEKAGIDTRRFYAEGFDG